MSYFAASETCLVIEALLSFVLGDTILVFLRIFFVLTLVLDFTSYNSVTVPVCAVSLFLHVGHCRLKSSLLLGSFPQSVVDSGG